MNTADLLTAYETCDRKGFWSRDWQRHRLDATDFLRQAIRAGMTETERGDFGEVAGERVMELAADPGMEMPTSRNLYESVIHHAALADALTTAIRRPDDKAWGLPPNIALNGLQWHSGAFLDPSGSRLRRIVLATAWNDERHRSEVRSWQGLGEVAAYGLPMTMVVLILGQHRDGRRNGPWTRGFLHPSNHQLRFRKKARVSYETFSDRWEQVWREDRGEISTKQWLEAMLRDDVLRDVCFKVEIEVPAQEQVRRIREMATRKRGRLLRMRDTPEASMSVCDRPPCPFRGCCWSEKPYAPSEKMGFVSIRTDGGMTGRFEVLD